MNRPRTRPDGLQLAITRAGNICRLAEALGITNQAVGKWQRVPVERCLQVERVTGVSRYVLRPDIYGDPPGDRRAHLGNVSAAAA